MKQILLFILLLLFLPESSSAQFLEWAYQYSGTGGDVNIGTSVDDWGLSVTVDLDGNVITAGRIFGQADMDFQEGVSSFGETGDACYYVSKYDDQGNLIWQNKTFGFDLLIFEEAQVSTDSYGNVYYINNFTGTRDVDPGPDEYLISSNGDISMVLIKYNPDGIFQWAIPLGSETSDGIHLLGIDSAQNVIIGGAIIKSVDFDPGPNEAIETPVFQESYTIWMAKYSPEGDYVWSFITDVTGEFVGVSFSTPFAMDIDSEDNIIISGGLFGGMDFDPGPEEAILTSQETGGDVYVAKYSSEGDYVWSFLTSSPDLNTTIDLIVNAEDEIYITGYMGDGVSDFDPGSGEYLLTCDDFEDVFLAKYSSLGEFLWAFNMGEGSHNRGQDLALDSEGNVLLAGQMTNPMDVDPGPDVVMLSPAHRNSFVCTYSPEGTYLNSMVLDGNSESFIFSIATGFQDEFYLTGLFRKTSDFDPGISECLLHVDMEPIDQDYTADAFLAKYTKDCIPADQNTIEENLISICEGETINITIPDSVELNNSCAWALYFGSCGSEIIQMDSFGIFNFQPTESGYWYVGAAGGCPGAQACDSIYIDVDTDEFIILPDTTICLGDTIEVFGEPVFETGTYTQTYTTGVTCDSTVQQTVLALYFGTSIELQDSMLISSSGDLIQWIDCLSGEIIPGANEITFVPEVSGSFAAQITLGGCMNTTECVEVAVAVSTGEHINGDVRIFPNPTSDYINIDIPKSRTLTSWSLLDVNGREILKGQSSKIDVRNLVPGLYFLQLEGNTFRDVLRMLKL